MTPKPVDPQTLTASDLDFEKANISSVPSATTTSTSIVAPVLDATDDLHAPIDVDINKIVDELWERRTQNPIVPRADKAQLQTVEKLPRPTDSLPLEEVVDHTQSILKDYSRHIQHPGHFGFLAPTGVRTDPMAFAMTAAANQNCAMYMGSPVGTTLETTVTNWLCELAGYDMSTGPKGKLLSGGSTSNLTAIATAMCHHFGPEYRSKGIAHFTAKNGKVPVLICSEAAHFCFQRAAGMLGLGVDNVITIPSDENYSMRMDLLKEAVEKYHESHGIVSIAATAGTTLTGGIDNLPEIAEICKEKNIWFHVDAAYGGSALMSAELRPLLKGIEHADSITMDLHKWFYMSLDCSAILYKNPNTVRSLFTDTSASLKSLAIDSFATSHMFFLLGPELSRRMRALPLYMAFRHFGMDKMGRNILFNVKTAKYLADRIKEEPTLELVYASKLSVALFRRKLPSTFNYVQSDKTPEMAEDDLNNYIRDKVEEEDSFFMSGANIANRPCLRCMIVNYNTRPSHMDQLLTDIKRIGDEWIKLNDTNQSK